MPLNLIIVNFGNLTFKILQSNLSITFSSFLFIYSFMVIMQFSLLSSSFITFCFSMFLKQLNRFLIPSIYMSYFTTATRCLFPHFSTNSKLSSLLSSLALIFFRLGLDVFKTFFNKLLLF